MKQIMTFLLSVVGKWILWPSCPSSPIPN